MSETWRLLCPPPVGLVVPRRVDEIGRAATRRAGWRRSSPGYWVPPGADRRTFEQRILEESMRALPDGAVSGLAALRIHGGGYFDGLRYERGGGVIESPVDLVVPFPRDIRSAATIRKHRARLPADEVVGRYGIRVTVAVRALFDAISWAADFDEAVSICDLSTSARLATRSELTDYLAARRGQRHVNQVEPVLAASCDRVMSPMETPLRLIWQRAGLPPVLCNWPVYSHAGTRIGKPDLLCPQLGVVGEYDGKGHNAGEVREVDLTKQDAYQEVGLEYFRVIGQDLPHPDRIAQRMVAAAERARVSGRGRRFLIARNPGSLV